MKALLEFLIGAAIAGASILAVSMAMGGRMDW